MKFTADKSELLTAIGRCLSVSDPKSTMPVLANVYLEADEDNLLGTLIIAATDLYRSIRVEIAGSGISIDQGGSICLPARDLFDRIKLLPEGKVAVSVEGTKATIKAAGSSRRYTMHGQPGEEFPKLPEPTNAEPGQSFKASTLAALIGATQFSVSTDTTRIHLNSLLVESDRSGALRLVSTDGHRLTLVTEGGTPEAGSTQWLIPLNAVSDLRKLFESAKDQEVTLSQQGSNLFVTMPEFTFSTKLVDASFPPYQQVIPSAESIQRRVAVNRSALTDALRAVSVAANDKTGGVKFTFRAGALRLESSSPDSGEGFDEISIDYEDKDATIGLNARYVLDVLAVISDDAVSIESSGELDPVIIRPVNSDQYLGVVMPMRIN